METLFVNISSMNELLLFTTMYAAFCVLIWSIFFALYQIISDLLARACKRLKLRWQNRRANKRK